MSKSAMLVKAGIVAALVALGTAAQAQTAGSCISTVKGKYCFIGGSWSLVTGSLECSWLLGRVPGTASHPAMAECLLDIRSVELVCENPTSHQVSPGESATRTVLVGTSQITDALTVSKERGMGTFDPIVFDTEFLNSTFRRDEYCVNPNWDPSPVYTSVAVRTVVAHANNYSCPDGTASFPAGCTLCSTLEALCTLPAEYNLTVDKSGAQPYWPPPVGTPYSCEITGATSTGQCK